MARGIFPQKQGRQIFKERGKGKDKMDRRGRELEANRGEERRREREKKELLQREGREGRDETWVVRRKERCG